MATAPPSSGHLTHRPQGEASTAAHDFDFGFRSPWHNSSLGAAVAGATSKPFSVSGVSCSYTDSGLLGVILSVANNDVGSATRAAVSVRKGTHAGMPVTCISLTLLFRRHVQAIKKILSGSFTEEEFNEAKYVGGMEAWLRKGILHWLVPLVESRRPCRSNHKDAHRVPPTWRSPR